jgi:UDP-N-acetylglucosamine diphosphorylase/glucosamine-1-phosphate N-acetyltransferase
MIVLFEDSRVGGLAPLVRWRPVWDLRCGIRTLREKASALWPGLPLTLWGRPALAAVCAARGSPTNQPVPAGPGHVLLVNARAILERPVPVSGPPEAGLCGEEPAWIRLPADAAAGLSAADLLAPDGPVSVLRRGRLPTVRADAVLIARPWDLVYANPRQIELDFRAGWSGFRHSDAVDPRAVIINEAAVQVGRGARVRPLAVLDAEAGPISIGRGAVISPHSYIQGPAVIGDGTLVQPGSVIRGGSTIGPVCKVGGEIEGSILIGFSNKQHDGFLGHSVLGEWCNLGAGTTNSDLKNTYGPVRVRWAGEEADTGKLFVGLTLGDHSKTAIGTRFATGAMIGFSCNILLSGVCPQTVPDMTWLTDSGPAAMDPAKAVAIARKMMGRRSRELSPAEAALFEPSAG